MSFSDKYDLRNREIRFDIYSRKEQGDFVSVDVFVEKIKAMHDALKKADQITNTKKAHAYSVTFLRLASAEVGFTEQPLPKGTSHPLSSVAALAKCANYIQNGDFEQAIQYKELGTFFDKITKDVGETYSHIEMLVDREPICRIDAYFKRRVDAFFHSATITEKRVFPHFRGSAIESFDGSVKEVDFRGTLWRGKFVLHAADKEIDCLFRGFSLDEVRNCLLKRVSAEGVVQYLGDSDFPAQIDIKSIRHIKTSPDLQQWEEMFNIPQIDIEAGEFEDEF